MSRLSQTLRRLSVLLAAAACVTACSKQDRPAESDTQGAADAGVETVFFRDVTAASGVDFVHVNGATGQRMSPEMMGSGGCAIDFDNDHRQDLYLVQSGYIPGTFPEKERPRNKLYRNLGNFQFEDVTEAAGVGDRGFGMGAACADYDNDGDYDIYVANFGQDLLYANNGDGTFTNVTETAGINSPDWGASAMFFDANNDGYLDLYVTNYFSFDVEDHEPCYQLNPDLMNYCDIRGIDGSPDVFFTGGPEGIFVDRTDESGLFDVTENIGKALALAAGDFNNDGWLDIYVANDTDPNFLFRNTGKGHFEEIGVAAGASHSETGAPESGMGVDHTDLDGDGYLDVIVTNWVEEANALYMGGEEYFTYSTRNAGLYEASHPLSGFGIDFADFDNDGDLDLVVANGNVLDNFEEFMPIQTFRQPAQLFLNDGRGQFTEAPPELSGDLANRGVGRGTITVDLDDDGRLDLVLTHNNEPVAIYRNVWSDAGNWVGVFLTGKSGNREAIGARLQVESGAGVVLDERKAGSSYLTSGDPRMHFGLGNAEQADRITVRWPGGYTEKFENVSAGRYHVLEEGTGVELTSPVPDDEAGSETAALRLAR